MEITDNSFLRQFETETGDGLAKIEYAQQERKFSDQADPTSKSR